MSTHLLTKDQGRPGLSAADEPVLRVAAGAGDRISFETDDAAYAQMEELRDLSKITALLRSYPRDQYGEVKLVIRPYDKISPGAIVLTAWNWIDELTAYDEARVVQSLRTDET